MPPPSTPWEPAIALLSLVLTGSLWTWAAIVGRVRRGRPVLPEARARSVPWGPWAAIAIVLLYAMLMTVVPSLVQPLLRGEGAKAEGPSPDAMLAMLAGVNAAVLLLVPATLVGLSGARLADLGLSGRRFLPDVGLGLAAFLALTPVVYATFAAAMSIWGRNSHPLEQMLRADGSASSLILAIVSGVILAPIAEELVFRGVIQASLARSWDRPRTPDEPSSVEVEESVHPVDSPAATPTHRASISDRLMPNLMTSALFAVTHAAQWPAPLAIFGLSMGLGLIFQRTGRLVAPIVLHLAFNGFGTLILFLSLG